MIWLQQVTFTACSETLGHLWGKGYIPQGCPQKWMYACLKSQLVLLATVHYTQTVSNYFTSYPSQYYCYSYNIMLTASLVKASSPFYSHYKWEELLLMCSLKYHCQHLIGQKFHLELWPKALYSIIFFFLPGLIMHGFRKFQLWILISGLLCTCAHMCYKL